MNFRELHVIEDTEQDLEEIAPPVLLECITVGLDDLEQHCEGAGPHVQLTPAHDARQLKQQREPAPHPRSVLRSNLNHNQIIKFVLV